MTAFDKHSKQHIVGAVQLQLLPLSDFSVDFYRVSRKKWAPPSILYQQVKNRTELNIVKHTQTCKYLSYCSQILYNSAVPFNIFSIFTKRHKFHFPTLAINLLTHGAYVMRDVKLRW